MTRDSLEEALRIVAAGTEYDLDSRADGWLFRRITASRAEVAPESIATELRAAPELLKKGLCDPACRMDVLRVLSLLDDRSAAILATVLDRRTQAWLRNEMMDGCREMTRMHLIDRLVGDCLLPAAAARLIRHARGQWDGRRWQGVTFEHARRDALTLAAQVTDACQSASSSWVVRNALPSLSRSDSNSADSPYASHVWATVAQGVLQEAQRLKWVSAPDVQGAPSEELASCLDLARDLAQTAWLTFRDLSDVPSSTLLAPECISCCEMVALIELARTERLCRRFTRAGTYAAFATAFDRIGPRSARAALSPEEHAELTRIADGLGLQTYGRDSGGAQARPTVSPFLAECVIRTDRQIGPLIDRVEKGSVFVRGFAEAALKRLATDPQSHGTDELLAGIELAFRTGSLQRARDIIHRVDKEGGAERRIAIPARLLESYAAALLSVNLQCIPLLHGPSQARFRIAVRRLFKAVPDGHLTDRQILLSHHAMMGVTHEALEHYGDGELARNALYASVTHDSTLGQYRQFASSVRFGVEQRMTRDAFLNGRLVMEADEVFVSLAARDGHEASILIVGPNGRSGHRICRTSRTHRSGDPWNWYQEIDLMFGTLCNEIRSGNPPERVRSAEIEQLLRSIVESVFEFNPNARRLLMHAQSNFRAIPWQFLLQTRLRDEVGGIVDKLRDEGRRRAPIEFTPLLVCMVPSVMTSRLPSNMRSATRGTIKWDASDTQCAQTVAKVRAVRTALSDTGDVAGVHLSAIYHGAIDGDVVRLLERQENVTTRNLREEFSNHPLALLHVCHGPFDLSNRFGDFGGIVGFLFAHGTRTAFASAVPVLPDVAERIERYFAEVYSDDPNALEQAYRAAFVEDPRVALYTYYSRPRAPVLDAVDDEACSKGSAASHRQMRR